MSVQSWLESGDPLGDRFWLSPKKGKRMEVSDSLDWSHRRGVVIFFVFYFIFAGDSVHFFHNLLSKEPNMNLAELWLILCNRTAILLTSKWRKASLSRSLSFPRQASIPQRRFSPSQRAALSQKRAREREHESWFGFSVRIQLLELVYSTKCYCTHQLFVEFTIEVWLQLRSC